MTFQQMAGNILKRMSTKQNRLDRSTFLLISHHLATTMILQRHSDVCPKRAWGS